MPAPCAHARQIVVVVAQDWDSQQASLQGFQRDTLASAWQAAGACIPCTLGRGGLGWGPGLHPETDLPGPRKREGDGRSPAGIFTLTGLFGRPLPAAAPAYRLPYQAVHQHLKGIDDPRSAYYNQIVDERLVKPDWQSCEEMLRDDQRYDLGITLSHNQACQPDLGSCVFMHVWAAPGLATAGCTAMSIENLHTLAAWLEPQHQPCLVQLPLDAYLKQQAAWQLAPPPLLAA